MSTFPPDEPTRVVRQPAVPVERAVPAAGVPVGVDPRWAGAMEDRLRSLRTLTTLLGLLSLIALGVAIWALTHDSDSGRQGASRSRVAALSRRVDRLDSRSAATTGATANAASAKDLATLQAQVDALKSRAGSQSGKTDGASSADVTALSTRVDRLAAQVAQLRANGGGDTGTTSP